MQKILGRADYVLEKLLDVSRPDLMEARCYRQGVGVGSLDWESFSERLSMPLCLTLIRKPSVGSSNL